MAEQAQERLGEGPAVLAERQLRAYNAKDLEAFLAVYAEDVEVRTLGSDEVTMRGRDGMRPRYERLFRENPQLRCEVVKRIVTGAFAIDEERLTGYADGREARATAIYETRGGSITKVWFIR
jgi:uncharacterized protein (TIGR02246 family)